MKESAEVAVGRLFEEHGARLYRLGVRFCGNADEAHDLVQDVFLQAFRGWKQFDGRSSPSTWLYTIAARRCQRRHRRRAGEPASITSLSSLPPSPHDRIVHIASDANPFDDAVRKQLQDRVASAVAALPAQMRLPLVLAEIAEIPLKDVARVLGLKLGTVKSRVHRARLAVRERIAAGLPSRPGAATDHDHRFCQDLLQAKQEALDRGVPLLVSDGDLCDRCKSLFATLDLSRDVCRLLAQGEIPPELARVVDVAKSTASRTPGRKAVHRRVQR
jgi:RNA polymerase sigma-70 factor (ECF subfamily)